ncbi:MAG: restriction endonuclease, partial [Leptospiraceae bacterium]|nr:restriction endonuclease [Leptospiraceae bacterium]
MSREIPGYKSPFELLIADIRDRSVNERDRGRRFEELVLAYLTTEPEYKDLYQKVWRFSDWVREEGHRFGFADERDTGIDLVALDRDGNWVAIQCKFYAQWHKVEKKDIDSFFTASGKKPFGARLIVTTSSRWSENAEAALKNQNPPVTVIKYQDLENSCVDWSKFAYGQAAVR